MEDADRRWGLKKWVLQQDNARPHIATQTIVTFDHFLCINFLDNWPPCSPDINPIEIIWAIMKKKIEKLNPSNINELKQILQQVWDNLFFAIINGLVDSVPAVIANGGRTIQKLN